jgi:hypothetical protein
MLREGSQPRESTEAGAVPQGCLSLAYGVACLPEPVGPGRLRRIPEACIDRFTLAVQGSDAFAAL